MNFRPVHIDPRAGSGDLHLHPVLRHISQLTTLACADRQLGDVMIYGKGDDGKPTRAIVEVKSPGDFLSGMARNTGRLARQVVDVLGHDGEEPLAHEYWIAVYGTMVRGKHGALLTTIDHCPYPNLHEAETVGPLALVPYRTARDRPPVDYDTVEATFLTLSRAGVQRAPYLPTKDALANWIAILARHLARPPSKHATLRTLPDRGLRTFLPPLVDPVTKRMVAVATDLLEGAGGGVGPKTAIAVATKFKSVLAMVNADENEWRVAKLIGPPTAKRIVNAIREEKK